MSETRYGKYITYKTEVSPMPDHGTFPAIQVVKVNDTVIKGAFYFECVWFTRTISKNEALKPHRHDFDEHIGIFGSNAEDPFNLCGEVEFWFDDEKHIIIKSCAVFIPKGVWHTPILINRLDRPIIMISTAPTLTYGQHVNHDPKWSYLKDPPESEVLD
jgi:hypothetical protein